MHAKSVQQNIVSYCPFFSTKKRFMSFWLVAPNESIRKGLKLNAANFSHFYSKKLCLLQRSKYIDIVRTIRWLQ